MTNYSAFHWSEKARKYAESIDPSTLGKVIIPLTGDSGTLTDEQTTILSNNQRNYLVICDGKVFQLCNTQLSLTYKTFINIDAATTEYAICQAIYVQLDPTAVNYKHWSRENIDLDVMDAYTKAESDARFATSTQGSKADSAVQPAYLSSAINTHDTSESSHTDIRSLIATIVSYILSDTSVTNQLVNKAFVNSSIATNTANFIGTFDSVAELEAYSGTKTPNDYAFVQGVDSAGNKYFNRYKWTGSAWLYEYTLNNSSFTAAQWAAINSAITAAKVTNYDNHLSNSTIHVTSANKTTWNNKQNALVSGTNIKTLNGSSILGGGNLSFATTTQGDKADNALQPNDNISLMTNNVGYITGITQAMVTTALGYTPYNATNPSGYQTSAQVDTKISTHNSSNTAHSDIRTAIAGKSTVTVSSSGTSTSEVKYITINGVEKKIGGGGGGADEDNLSITKNSSQKIQTVGVIDQHNTSRVIKEWSGTRAEYLALGTHDSNTKYTITDDGDLSLPILQTLYPVGSLYITTNATCPLANLFGTWQKVAQDKVLQGAGTRGAVGTTLNESLPNITGTFGAQGMTDGGLTTTGAFKTVSMSKGTSQSYSSSQGNQFGFDASLKSAAYQNNAPVQQDAYLINIFRRTA